VSAITLNSITIAQPSEVKEEFIRIEHDRVTANGTMRRYYFGTKWQVTLEWPFILPADYQTIINMMTTGQSVVYANPTSGEVGGSLTFTGLPKHVTDKYIRGASLLRDFTVILRQV